jgi:hypothetical protein
MKFLFWSNVDCSIQVSHILYLPQDEVVPVLPLTEHHALKAYWGVEVQLHPFFDLGTGRR